MSTDNQTIARLDPMRSRGERDKDRMLEPGPGVKITFRSDGDRERRECVNQDLREQSRAWESIE